MWLATLLITASVLASMSFRQRFKGSTWEIVLPLIAPSLLGVGLLTFTLSYDEFTRTSLVSGQNNTLPLEIFGMTTNVTSPALYALGTLTTVFSASIILIAFFAYSAVIKRQRGQA